MKPTRCFLSILLFALLLPVAEPARAQSDDAHKDIFLAKTLLMDVTMRSDREGLLLARSRFEHLIEQDAVAALAHYYYSFANWQLSFLAADSEEAITLLEEGISHLKTALALDEHFADAYVLGVLSYYPLYRLTPRRAREISAEEGSMLAKALELAPENPRVALAEAQDLFYSPPPYGGSQERGLQRYQDAIRLFAQQSDEDQAYPDWGHAMAYAWMGGAYLNADQPDVRKARAAFEEALALRPDYALVKYTLLPSTNPVAALPARRFSGLSWTLLASDDQGDGRDSTLADGKALHYYYDTQTDSLWFKIDLYGSPNPIAFGLNLVVDADQNQENGGTWWGRNNTFTYDKLVTVWVASAGPAAYAGTIGIADASGVQQGRFTNLAQRNIALSVDTDNQALYVGLKRTDLDEDGTMNLIAAVGSNRMWNDDIADTGHSTIVLPPIP